MKNNTPSPKKKSSVGLDKKVLRLWACSRADSPDKTRMVEVAYCKELDIWHLVGKIKGQRKRTITFSAPAMRAILGMVTKISNTVAMERTQTDEQLPPAEKSYYTQNGLSLGEKENEKDGE